MIDIKTNIRETILAKVGQWINSNNYKINKLFIS